MPPTASPSSLITIRGRAGDIEARRLGRWCSGHHPAVEGDHCGPELVGVRAGVEGNGAVDGTAVEGGDGVVIVSNVLTSAAPFPVSVIDSTRP